MLSFRCEARRTKRQIAMDHNFALSAKGRIARDPRSTSRLFPPHRPHWMILSCSPAIPTYTRDSLRAEFHGWSLLAPS